MNQVEKGADTKRLTHRDREAEANVPHMKSH